MPLSLSKEILARLHSLGYGRCILLGGEPTLHPDLIEIILYGYALGIQFALVSNGLRFADEAFCDEVIAAGLGEVTLSLTATAAKSTLFSKSEKGYFNLTRRGLTPQITVTIASSTTAQLSDMLYWIVMKRIERVNFNVGIPIILPSGIDASETLPPDELGERTMQIYRAGQALGVHMTFRNLPLCVLSREAAEELTASGSVCNECAISNPASLLFNVKGELIPCNHLADYPICSWETMKDMLNDDRFEDFLASTKMQGIRDIAYAHHLYYCGDCELWDKCHGGCPLIWTYYSPRDYIMGWHKEGE